MRFTADIDQPERPAREIVLMKREKLPIPTVLVVDDEALIRWSLSEGLSDSGFPVLVAGSAAEARRELHAHQGDLVILLDLRLPDVSDLSLLREVRTTRPDAPVVMMTAHGAPEEAAEAARLGASAFVGKPFDVSEIVRLVGEAWSRRVH